MSGPITKDGSVFLRHGRRGSDHRRHDAVLSNAPAANRIFLRKQTYHARTGASTRWHAIDAAPIDNLRRREPFFEPLVQEGLLPYGTVSFAGMS